MLTFIGRFGDMFFEQYASRLVFFPYGVAWAGYEVTTEFRDRVKPLVGAYFAYAVLFFLAHGFVPYLLRSDVGPLLLYPWAILVFCSYALDVWLLTRGFGKARVDPASKNAELRVARLFPVWTLYILCGAGALMTFAGLLELVFGMFQSPRNLVSAAEPFVFFGLSSLVSVGQLRLARMLRRPDLY